MSTSAGHGIHDVRVIRMSRFININSGTQPASDGVSFSEALLRGLAQGDGLYMPAAIEPLDDLPGLLALPFVERSVRILRHLIGADRLADSLPQMLETAFDFPVPLQCLDQQVSVLELFHGPSMSFKDFGARFLAGCLQHSRLQQPVTVLTATSGDTGGAVARAFFGHPDVHVVVLYPQGGVTPEQSMHFVGLGGNVRSVAVDGSFDDCQGLVKQAFGDDSLSAGMLISANSINVARLLAQVCYYFELAAQHPAPDGLTVAIPSGNFGNATAAMIACALGLPLRSVLAVTNENDTVPRYLLDGQWLPKSVVQTITNAIDIAAPNNFSRIEHLHRQQPRLEPVFQAGSISEQQTRQAMLHLSEKHDYLADPHTALAWAGLCEHLKSDQQGVVVATAHPAKFADEVSRVTGITPQPTTDLDKQSDDVSAMPPEYARLKTLLEN